MQTVSAPSLWFIEMALRGEMYLTPADTLEPVYKASLLPDGRAFLEALDPAVEPKARIEPGGIEALHELFNPVFPREVGPDGKYLDPRYPKFGRFFKRPKKPG